MVFLWTRPVITPAQHPGTPDFAATIFPPAFQGSSGACSEDGAIVCEPDGQSFSICVNGLTFMGQAAAGTVCQDDGIDCSALMQ